MRLPGRYISTVILSSLACVSFADIDYGYIQIANDAQSLFIANGTTVNVLNSGWTALSGGQLVVDGILNGMTVAMTGGTLSGTGTLNMWGEVNNSGGTLLPGSGAQIGQLTINGDYMQGSGGALLINLSAAGASSLLVNGTATLNGALRGGLLNGFTPVNGTQYTILTANVVAGQFNGTPAFITPLLLLQPTYTATNVNVTVSRDYENPALLSALSVNQRIMLASLNSISQSSAVIAFDPVLNVLDALPNNAAVADALTEMEPIGNDVLLNLAVNNQTFNPLVESRRLKSGIARFQDPCLPGLNILLAGNFYDGTANDRLEGDRYDFRSDGELIGFEHALTPNFSLGVLTQFNQAKIILDAGSHVRAHSYMAAPYVDYQYQQWFMNAMLGYSYNDYHLNRKIAFGSLFEAASSSPAGHEIIATLSGGYDYNYRPQWQIGPDLGIQYVNLTMNSYQESGAGVLDLSVSGQHLYSLRSLIGAHTSYQYQADYGVFLPYLSASYIHEFSQQPSSMQFAFIAAQNSNTSLVVHAPQRNFALLNAGVSFSHQKNWAINLVYTAQIESHHAINGITAEGAWSIS